MLSVRALILTVCFAHLIAGSARCRSGGCCDEVCGTYCNEHHACHADDTRCRNVGEACELKNIVQGWSAASAHKNEGKLQSRHVGNATNNKQAKVATFVAQAKAKAQQAKPQAAANAQALGSFAQDAVLNYLRVHNGNGGRFERAQATFCRSCAGLAVASHVLGISPRTLRYKLARMRECGIDVERICA